jgi:carboxylesterase
MEFFPGEAHQPFHLVGGRPAALVIHGFPGTPEEMRAIGEALHGQGWTVQGLLLPGFGAEIRTLIERRYAEWQAAVEGALAELKRDHHPVLLVGYSFGAALSIHTATRLAPDGLVLLAPFWWAEPRWLAPASLFLSPFLPHAVRPYARSNFGDPHFRAGLAKLLPEADWDDPATQHAIRRLAVPTTLFQEVRETRQVITLVRQLNLPTLIVQGRQDAMVRAANTQRLVAEWGKQAQPRRAPRYVEVDAGHDLTERRSMGWAHVERAVLEFSAQYLQ